MVGGAANSPASQDWCNDLIVTLKTLLSIKGCSVVTPPLKNKETAVGGAARVLP